MVCVIFGILVVMFLFSGCITQFFDPQYYKFRKLEYDTSGLYVLDEKLYEEAKRIGQGKILQNGYKLNYEGELDRAKIDSRIESAKRLMYSYNDDNGQKHIISYNLCYSYYTLGLWLVGDEGGGFRIKVGDKSVCLWNRNNAFCYDKKTNTFIKRDNNDK